MVFGIDGIGIEKTVILVAENKRISVLYFMLCDGKDIVIGKVLENFINVTGNADCNVP